MPGQKTRTVTVPDVGRVRIRAVDRVAPTTVRVDVRQEARWRLDVEVVGNGVELVASWNEDGELADVPLPEWLDAVLARLGGVGC
jgi:hypothetical protein